MCKKETPCRRLVSKAKNYAAIAAKEAKNHKPCEEM